MLRTNTIIQSAVSTRTQAPTHEPQTAPYTHREMIFGSLEVMLVATAIVLCVVFPSLWMLPGLAVFGFLLSCFSVWGDSMRS